MVRVPYRWWGISQGSFFQNFSQELKLRVLQQLEVFIRYSILVLIQKSIRFVLNIVCIMNDCKGCIRKAWLLEVVFERRSIKVGVQLVTVRLITARGQARFLQTCC